MDVELTRDEVIAVSSLLITIVLGVLAIVVSIVAERRSSKAAKNARETLHGLQAAVRAVDGQVKVVERQIMSFFTDVLKLVDSSESAFQAAGVGTMKETAATRWDAEGPGLVGDGLESREESEQMKQAGLEALDQHILDLARRDGGRVKAGDLVEAVSTEASLFMLLREMYRLRLSGGLAWDDAVLTPDTDVWVQL